MVGYYVALFICIFSILAITGQQMQAKGLQHTIDRQQDTIQKLLNREPVTYAEVGSKPSKKASDVYAAWGSQMVNIDEDEQHS